MYCPLLCMKSKNEVAPFGQCLKEACAWWITVNGTGKCAICQLGLYAGSK